MAEVILKKLAEDKNFEIQVNSAGIQAIDGIPAYPYARMALRKNGYIDKKHVSKTISEELLQDHDCVITMEVQQRDFLKFSFPQFGNRIHTLTELAMDMEMDIDDPIKLEYIVYEKTFKMIEDYTIKVFEKLIRKYKLECQ